MHTLINFLKEFYKNHGFLVFVSFFIQKLSAFIISLIVIRLLTKEEFGLLSIVPAVFVMFAPFTGLGLPVGLLRYGSLVKDENQKRKFISTMFRDGFYFQILLSVFFISISVLFVRKYEDIFIIFVAFAVRLFGFLIFMHQQIVFRINFQNNKFASLNIYNAAIGVILVAVACYLWGFYGYLIAIAIHPYFTLFWTDKKHFNLKEKFYSFDKREVYKFSLHASFTNFGTDLLFAADILLLSYFFTESSVAGYKVAILIPANVIFLTQSFIQSDYPKIVANSENLKFIKNYIKQYFKIFIPISVFIFLFGYFFKEQIISLFFGERYLYVSKMFSVFLITFLISMLFKVFFGNLLSAIGKMSYVTYGTIISVLVIIISSLILMPLYREMGMVYSMFIAISINSIFLFVMLAISLKKMK